MKKRFSLLLSVFSILLITSCTNLLEGNKTGITVQLPGPKSSREAGATAGTDTYYFTITCKDSSGKNIIQEKSGVSGDTIVFDQVDPGKYTIIGEAFADEDKTEISYVGDAKAEVLNGENTDITLSMKKAVITYAYKGDTVYPYMDNFMETIELDNMVGNKSYGKTKLKDLPDEYSIYIYEEEINKTNGKFQSDASSPAAYESLLGYLKFNIRKDSEIISEFTIDLQPVGFDISVGLEGSSILIDSVEFPSVASFFAASFTPVYKKYNSETAVFVESLPTTKVYAIDGTPGEVSFAADANWKWTVKVGGTTNTYDVMEIEPATTFNVSDFTIDTTKAIPVEITCAFVNTDVTCISSSKKYTASFDTTADASDYVSLATAIANPYITKINLTGSSYEFSGRLTINHSVEIVPTMNCTFSRATTYFEEMIIVYTEEASTNNVAVELGKTGANVISFVGVEGMVYTGSAIAVAGAKSNLIVNNCMFENIKASTEGTLIQGAAINVSDGGKLSVLNGCKFINNTSNKGGAICSAGETSELTVDGATFEGNTATTYGGAIQSELSKTTIKNSTFNKNVASQDFGGAIMMNVKSNVILSGNVFGSDDNANTGSSGCNICIWFDGLDSGDTLTEEYKNKVTADIELTEVGNQLQLNS